MERSEAVRRSMNCVAWMFSAEGSSRVGGGRGGTPWEGIEVRARVGSAGGRRDVFVQNFSGKIGRKEEKTET
jgi:hypothetical protein